MYYTYVLRCRDNALYTGITTDVARRLAEHAGQGPRCAKYTLAHPVRRLEAVWQSASRSDACRLEYQIKRLPKAEKEALLRSGSLARAFGTALDPSGYHRCGSQAIARWNAAITPQHAQK